MNFITYHFYYYCFLVTPIIEDCYITPPLNVTVAPQQYIVNMITSKVPPKLLKSQIKFKTPENCSNQDGISCGTPYYFHLGKEMYYYSLPITWSAANSEFTHHEFECGAMFGSTQVPPKMTNIRGVCMFEYIGIYAFS